MSGGGCRLLPHHSTRKSKVSLLFPICAAHSSAVRMGSFSDHRRRTATVLLSFFITDQAAAAAAFCLSSFSGYPGISLSSDPAMHGLLGVLLGDQRILTIHCLLTNLSPVETATMKVHGDVLSIATQRVLACLYEKQLDFEFVPVDIRTSAHKKQPFISLNV
ncbi:hypothetical protein RHMOL_Rhmol13G0017000 [Rhododendron molle]|uniref:Uncharacterized protein n=1 Tax=Rhododendron molle TaxID=49168 RepID=A0ACC0L1W6_RHOML|nr:hypothetical protein RHMOL_Rhmol13G0017000 [Rhododendron molle]